MFRINKIFMKACILLICTYSALAYSADLARENRLYAEIVDSILDGEPLWFEGDGHKYLGIYTESAKEKSKGEVLVLHGRGLHVDWQDVINPVRTGLTEYGWNTLSLQLPVLEKEAMYYDYAATFPDAALRIEKAIEYLKSKNPEKIIIVAHSCGFHMANTWLRLGDSSKVDAFIGIGMGATDTGQSMVEDFNFSKLKAPVLDIYGENDFGSVIGTAFTRKIMLEFFAKEKSVQIKVPAADHYFKDKGDELVELINNWLDNLK